MTPQSTQKQTFSISSILICILLAGVTAMILSMLVSQFNWPEIYSSLIPVIVSVPVGMLGMFSWQKGFKNLSSNDIMISIMGGVGATIGLLIVRLFA